MPEGSMQRKCQLRKRSGNFIIPVADGTVKVSGEDQDLRTSTSIQDSPDRGEEQDNLRGETDGSSSNSATNDFGSISGDFTYRHRVEPRVKLYVQREESFPFPLEYIDVTRTTYTALDVMLEKQIEDYWNVDGDKRIVRCMDRMHKIHCNK